MLSQKTRYALKALLELGTLPPGATLSCAAISSRRAIPVKFLEAILAEMKRDGLVWGQRGRSGGYRLARATGEISFGDVVRLMQGPLGLIPCVTVSQYARCEDCAAIKDCELQKIFRVLRDSTATILDGWSLEDARGNGNVAAPAKKAPRRPAAKSAARKKGTARAAVPVVK